MAANQKQSRLKRKAKLAHRKRRVRILTTSKQTDNKNVAVTNKAAPEKSNITSKELSMWEIRTDSLHAGGDNNCLQNV